MASLIEKPTKDKILIVSEARSGSTALWTYLWTKYYQEGVNGKCMRTWLEPFNYDMDVQTGKKARTRQTRLFLRHILCNPDDPWLVKIILKYHFPVLKDPAHRRIIGVIGKTNYQADRIIPKEEESYEDAENKEWERFFNAYEKKAAQDNLVGDLFSHDPSVYRIKLYRRDIIATMMSHLELHNRENILKEKRFEGKDFWHQTQGQEREIFEYPDLKDKSVEEIADICQFWYRTWTRERLQMANSSSEPPYLFDAEYAYEDVADELIAFNPKIEYDENNPMHYDNWDVCNKSGIIVPEKPHNYQETYDIVADAYHRWFRVWKKQRAKRGMHRFY